MLANQFHITVSGETARLEDTGNLILTSGSSGIYEAVFTTDDSWQDLTLEAVFLAAPAGWPLCQEGALIRRCVPLTDGRAAVPADVLSVSGYLLHVGLSGIRQEVERNSTMSLVCPIAPGAATEGPGSQDIPETRYQELRREIDVLKESTAPDTSEPTITPSVEPAAGDIPKVFFGSELPSTKLDTQMSFRYISNTQDISGYCSMRVQGSSSLFYPKKNQTVRLYSDADCTEKLKLDFYGWGQQSKHCYKANWIDLTHARNVVSARAWADMVKARTGYALLPAEFRESPNQGATDGFPIKVYAGGIYQGRYTMNIPKDKWAFNMDDSLDEHCILCGENYESGCFRASAIIDGSDWTDEIHDTVPDSILTRWNQVIDFVQNSTNEAFAAGLDDYFYVDSLIDYHIFGLLSCGLDAYGKNQIYATYDGQKWIASMYDMDSTWGLWWSGSQFVDADYDRSEYQDFADGSGNLLYIRLESLFYEALIARWNQLKTGVLSVPSLIHHFEQFTDLAPESLVKEDYASTTGGGAFTEIPLQTTNNIQQIRAFIVARHAWMDTYLSGLIPVPCTAITLSETALSFTADEAQTLHAEVTPSNTTDTVIWTSSDQTVCTVVGGVVTPIANGDATITAVCGSMSADCTVSVAFAEPDDTFNDLETALSVLYQLPQAMTFDGVDDYCDTGLQLFDTSKDFSITIDFEDNYTSGSSANKYALFHCINESGSPWAGISLLVYNTTPNGVSYCIGGIKTNPYSTGTHVWAEGARYKLRFCYDSTNRLVRFCNGDGTVQTLTIDNAYTLYTGPLVLGATRTGTDTYIRYWNGTIHSFTVYEGLLADSELTFTA